MLQEARFELAGLCGGGYVNEDLLRVTALPTVISNDAPRDPEEPAASNVVALKLGEPAVSDNEDVVAYVLNVSLVHAEAAGCAGDEAGMLGKKRIENTQKLGMF